jgi:alkylation response protein AidB-like acyl-CoA dehydrogenase
MEQPRQEERKQRTSMPDHHTPTCTFDSALPQQDMALIREHAAASDRAGMLAPPLQEMIHSRGWLRMLAPRDAGGAELALPDAVRLEEALAAADGSIGWTVTLCAGAGWFAGFLQPPFAREILSTPNLCIGGSGAPAGFADAEVGGYRITGRWDFATGAPMTTHFTLNAVLREGGQPLLDASGAPRVRAFIVPAGLAAVHQNWHTVGLKATASHSFSLDAVWVGAQHAFDITPQGATATGPLYRFPFLSLAFVTLAANVAGIAGAFVRLAREAIGERRHHVSKLPLLALPQVVAALDIAGHELAQTRARFYHLLDQTWNQVCRHEEPTAAQSRELHEVVLALVDASRRAVDALYPMCGLRAADERSEIGRVWRDFHTATQHALMLPVPC